MNFLKKKLGPFPVGIWLIIGAGGIALGLVLRKNFAAEGEETTSATGLTMDYSEAGPGGYYSGVSGGYVLPKEPFPTPQDGTVVSPIQAQIDQLELEIEGLTAQIASLGKQITAAKNPDVKESLRITQRNLIAEKAAKVAQLAYLKGQL